MSSQRELAANLWMAAQVELDGRTEVPFVRLRAVGSATSQ